MNLLQAQRVPGARRRYGHEHVAHHPVGGQQRGEPSHLVRRAPTSARPSPPAPSWCPRPSSGVITSQILRGLCEGSQGFDEFDVESIAGAFERAREVAFQAVRKPVEGTILTVLRDSAAAAKNAAEQELPLPDALDAIVAEAYASVQRTPDLLPVLRRHAATVNRRRFRARHHLRRSRPPCSGRDAGTMVDEMSFARGAHPKGESSR
ncbi:MAG: DAK2 domain-containing protein [Adlercreutzia equolifaciens]